MSVFHLGSRSKWASVSLAALIAAGVPSPASTAICTWNGGAGTWATGGGWSCGVVPGALDDVFIDGGNVINSVVTLGGARDAGTLAISSGDELAFASGTLTIHNSAVTNNGTITIGTNSRLRSNGNPVVINGAGTIVLNNAVGFSYIGDSGGIFTFGSGQTVRGRGSLGVNAGIFINNGLISADVATGGITIDVAGGNGSLGGTGVGTGGNAGFLNNATIEARDGGTISFNGGRYEQGAAGVIRAMEGSIVAIGSDARIIGGSLTSVGTGAITATSGTRYLDGVTLSSGSQFNQASGDTQLSGSFTNNGTVTLGVNTRLRTDGGSVSIDGTGTIVLDDSVGFSYIGDSGGIFTFGSGQTVRGRGDIGRNAGIFINNGVISANVSGATLDLDVAGGNGGLAGSGVGTGSNAGFLNNATIEARDGGILVINGGRYENAGMIQALADSTVRIDSDARIVGGTLASIGTGAIVTSGGGARYLDGVTLSTGSQYSHASAATVLGTIFTNNGTVTIGTNSRLQGNGSPVVINGTGTIVLDDSVGFSYIGDSGGIITFGSGQTVRGRGNMGLNAGIFINNGVISADVSGATLDIDASGGNGGLAGLGVGTGSNAGLLNSATIEARDGGILVIDGGRYENTGVIQALADSTVRINSDARIIGGTLTSVGTGAIAATTGTRYLDGVTLSTGSQFNQASGDTQLSGSFTNNGTVTLGVNARLRTDGGSVTIDGTGTIVLNNAVGFAYIGDTAGILTFGSGQTVRGRGNIGLNAGIFINNGVISADVSGEAISLDVAGAAAGLAGGGVGTGNNAGLFNTGTLGATNGGTLAVEGGLYENAVGGTFAATNGGTLSMAATANLSNLQAGGILNGGTYHVADGTLRLRATGVGSIITIGTNAVGTDTIVTLDGPGSVLNVQLGAVVTAIDSSLTDIAQSGRLEILGGRDFVAGAGTLANAGVVQLGGGTLTAFSFLNNTPGSETFGFGTIASSTLVPNFGSIRAAGGTLSFTGVISGPGSLMTEAGATLALGGTSTAGTLFNGGQLALGTSNITITSDYTSASFGSGNGFDGRANVSGSGLILAASATQDLSGPNLSGGVLDLGNIRVGEATSTDLVITNNGSLTTLRGAVQNSSAPGVTLGAPDFVIGPNGGSAVVSVNFAGVSSGSLDGQTIDVVNNFDNVANVGIIITGAAWNPAVGALSPDPVHLGNVRIGDAASGIVTIANIAPEGGFSEGLRVTGTTPSANASIGGVPGGIIAAGSSAQATVGISTAQAGAQAGVVGFDFVTDGTGTSGLDPVAIASGGVAITANVFALANPILLADLAFGNVQQGSVQTRTIQVSNALLGGVPLGFQEGLDAAFGTVANGFSGAGVISNLAAGGSDNVTLVVTLDTSSAGARAGTVQVLLASNGAGTSGLELFDLGDVLFDASANVSGGVFRLAEADVQPLVVALGNRRVGDAAPAPVALTISNTAIDDGFSESLDASVGATTGRATGAGAIALLAPQASSSAISVGIDTSVAGANGTVEILLASNGEGTSGLGVTPLASQTVTLEGGVYRLAVADVAPTDSLIVARVGDTAGTSITIRNTAVDDGFSEGLGVTGTPSGDGVSFGPADGLVAAGGQRVVSATVDTATAGVKTGMLMLDFTSDGAGTSGLSAIGIGSASASVEAQVFAAAVADVAPVMIDFGVVRVGDTVGAQAITILNGAVGALTDTLVTSAGGAPAGFGIGGTPGPLAAGEAGAVQVSLDTSTAGSFGGDLSLGFVSRNPVLDDLALGSVNVALAGTVNNLADPVFTRFGSALGFDAELGGYVFDLGSVTQGSVLSLAGFGIGNLVFGPADDLSGLVTDPLGGVFSLGGAFDIGLLAAGQVSDPFAIFLDRSTTGSFMGEFSFAGLGTNASDPVGLDATARLFLKAQVTDVDPGVIPEPATWAMMIIGFGAVGTGLRRRRRRDAVAA